MPHEAIAPPQQTMLRMMTGVWLSQAIYAAAKLGLADRLRDGAKSSTLLAEEIQTNPDALYRLLRALASVGIFSEHEARYFSLTPLARCLSSDAPESLRAFAIMLGEQEHWRAWGEILYSVTTGSPAFDHVFGKPHFQYIAEHQDRADIFNAAMTSRSAQENAAILSSYDFSNAKLVIDIGAGEGSLLAAILQANPNCRGMLFDLPHVIEAVESKRHSKFTPHRFGLQAGDFFNNIPSGGDVYLLKKILHNWDDAKALEILRNCRRAMSPRACLVLIEPVVTNDAASSFNKFLDLLMLLWTSGGRERTETEHRELLAATALRQTGVLRSADGLSVITAAPVDG